MSDITSNVIGTNKEKEFGRSGKSQFLLPQQSVPIERSQSADQPTQRNYENIQGTVFRTTSNTNLLHYMRPVKETKCISLSYDPVSKTQILNHYEIVKELGNGQHGKVKLAKDIRANQLVAIKMVNRYEKKTYFAGPKRNDPNKIKKEIAIMKKCNNKHVVKLIEILDDLSSRKIYLVLEYCEKGPILWCPRDQLEIDSRGPPQLSFQRAREIFRDVILGLEYLHSQGIIHRDIKPANLLMDKNGVVKISDFGVSLAANGNIDTNDDELELTKTVGTPVFYAPEICLGAAAMERFNLDKDELFNGSCISFKIDIWALGITLYCLLFGMLPFVSEFELKLFEKIVNEKLRFPTFETLQDNHISEISHIREFVHAKDLLNKLLEKNPAKRISIPDIKVHPFVCWDFKHTKLLSEDQLESKLKENSLFQSRQDKDFKQILISNKDINSAILDINEGNFSFENGADDLSTKPVSLELDAYPSQEASRVAEPVQHHITGNKFNSSETETSELHTTSFEKQLQDFDLRFKNKNSNMVPLPIDSSFASLDSFYVDNYAMTQLDTNSNNSSKVERSKIPSNSSLGYQGRSSRTQMQPSITPRQRNSSSFPKTSSSSSNKLRAQDHSRLGRANQMEKHIISCDSNTVNSSSVNNAGIYYDDAKAKLPDPYRDDEISHLMKDRSSRRGSIFPDLDLQHESSSTHSSTSEASFI